MLAAVTPGPHLACMSTYEFDVQQRQISGTRQHTWVAIDRASGTVIDLPAGGSGAWLGRYPEISSWLAGQGITAELDYSRARGDTFDADHKKGVYTWTFNTAGGIVVRDIPRLVTGMTIQV